MLKNLIRGTGASPAPRTAWFPLRFLAHPRPGDRVLIHSAAGGVGTSAVQLARAAGCEVVGVVGASHKVETAKAIGCQHVIDKSTQPLWPSAKTLSDRGYDIILDANGVSTLGDSYAHLRPGNRRPRFVHDAEDGGRPNGQLLDWLATPQFVLPIDPDQPQRAGLQPRYLLTGPI